MILDKLPNVFFITKLTFGRFFMRKKIVSLFLVLVLTMSFGSVAFASTEIIDDSGIQPYNTDTIIFEIDRTSSTTADVYVDVYFSQTVDIYNVVVYLQKKVDGEWVLDTSNPERTLYNNGFNKSAFYFITNILV